jgi:hypothetical protein
MLAFNVAATVTHCSDRKASRFWIMLWPVFGPADHGIMEGSLHDTHASFGATRSASSRSTDAGVLPAVLLS